MQHLYCTCVVVWTDKDDAVFDHFTCRLITVSTDVGNTVLDNFTCMVACTDDDDSVFSVTGIVAWTDKVDAVFGRFTCIVTFPNAPMTMW